MPLHRGGSSCSVALSSSILSRTQHPAPSSTVVDRMESSPCVVGRATVSGPQILPFPLWKERESTHLAELCGKCSAQGLAPGEHCGRELSRPIEPLTTITLSLSKHSPGPVWRQDTSSAK